VPLLLRHVVFPHEDAAALRMSGSPWTGRLTIMSYAHIACCTDGTADSRPALEHAQRLRGLSPGRLSVVHVAQWPLPYAAGFGAWVPGGDEVIAAARRRVEEVASDIPGAEPVALSGRDPAQTVIEWARGADVDLVVVGVHRTAFERATLGSFAGHMVNHAHCPVLLVR
jgi:nucleotide-binding universal stress UspA family protein